MDSIALAIRARRRSMLGDDSLEVVVADEVEGAVISPTFNPSTFEVSFVESPWINVSVPSL